MTMVSQAAGRIRVKASGGIRTLEDARAYVEMGAERLGVGFSTVPKLTAAEGRPSNAWRAAYVRRAFMDRSTMANYVSHP